MTMVQMAKQRPTRPAAERRPDAPPARGRMSDVGARVRRFGSGIEQAVLRELQLKRRRTPLG
jgi:hypothetical protein